MAFSSASWARSFEPCVREPNRSAAIGVEARRGVEPLLGGSGCADHTGAHQQDIERGGQMVTPDEIALVPLFASLPAADRRA
jgi:hypothetical protein